MKMAGEAKKRFDEAQREMERSALHRPEVDEEEEEKAVYGGESDRKSVREGDRELLEGEEAVVGVGKGGGDAALEEDLLGDLDEGVVDVAASPRAANGKVEFEL